MLIEKTLVRVFQHQMAKQIAKKEMLPTALLASQSSIIVCQSIIAVAQDVFNSAIFLKYNLEAFKELDEFLCMTHSGGNCVEFGKFFNLICALSQVREMVDSVIEKLVEATIEDMIS